MRKVKMLLVMTAAAALAACGGGGNTLGGGGTGTDDGTSGTPGVSSLTLLTSSPQVPSDGSAPATISALVRDENNNVMPDVNVVFSADTGSIAVAQPPTTDATGVVTAALSTGGDPTNRTITVTASAGGVQQTVSVAVLGTQLQINGPSSLPLSTTGNYTVVLTDAAGNGIAGKPVALTSSSGNGLSGTPVTTDALGQASFTLTANSAGTDTLTASALGIQATQPVAISSDVFKFSAPAPATEIPLGSSQSVTVNWAQNNSPVQGREVAFATTRGSIAPAATVLTDANGNATVNISANNAGPAVITATNEDGTSIQLDAEFVAKTPASLELQANPFSVPTNGQSTITAVVRDASGNLVKNQTVTFVLEDVTGGSLSVAQAVTNSQGRAQTVYNASSTTSAVEGVRIDAAVQGFAAATDSVALTVAQRELFISLGTGNEIEEPNTAQYKKTWVVQVTDAQGNAVKGVEVSFSILSDYYYQGYRVVNPGAGWSTVLTSPACPDEDVNRNGVLDPGEDQNGSTKIEAGNIATAVAGGGTGGKVTTDDNGFALIDVYWPQEYAAYLGVTLEARTSVQGTESAKAAAFVLDGLADDFNDEDVAPPGVISPFGEATSCATPPPGTP